jgi:hypothetical protein
MMIVGPQTASHAGKLIAHNEASGDPGDTILVAEVANSGVFWTEPRDLNFDEMSFQINDKGKPSISSYHVRGATVIFADGRVEFLDESTRPERLKALLISSARDDAEPKRQKSRDRKESEAEPFPFSNQKS